MENNDNKNKGVIIEVIDDGPIKITGNFILKDLKRDLTDTPEEVYLCRCGRSSAKPYCDNSHKK
ncbi:MAG TPA: CDGSH iron-sulfur domain-containing protein [Bacteroidales bacterium]|jgi:CDGSH-type Zn-finger protein|nr:CDGSH iron-sulfur domain-containing protein [Bacteroidales bacterium]